MHIILKKKKKVKGNSSIVFEWKYACSISANFKRSECIV